MLKLKPKHRRLLKLLSPALIFLVISVLLLGPRSIAQLHNSIFNDSNDSEMAIWFINWWRLSLAHHLNPFITRYIWAPLGFNVTWATSIPTVGLVMLPVTKLFSAVVSFNLLSALAPTLSALSCFYLTYYITRRYWPSLISGYIFGFSPYELTHLYAGHLTLFLDFLVPLLVLVFLLRLDARIGKTLYLITACILLIAQFGLSEETTATFLLFSLMTGLLFYFFGDKDLKLRLRGLTVETIMAGVATLVLLSPYIYYMIKGYHEVSLSQNNLPKNYSADLLNFIKPTFLTSLGQTVFKIAAFSSNLGEADAYLGIPFILTFIYIAVTNWRKNIALKVLGISLIAIAVFSLGPELHIGGKQHRIPLPWAIATHLPVLKYALPARFLLYVFLLLALVVGIWLSQPEKKRDVAVLKYLCCLISICFIIPASKFYSWEPLASINSGLYEPATISKYIKKGSNVVILPYAYLGNSMYFQYVSNMEFNQTGGYAGSVPYPFNRNRAVESLVKDRTYSGFASDFKAFCLQYEVSYVIYPDTPNTIYYPSIDNELQSLGWPAVRHDGNVILQVPNSRG